jgi:HTH-type transcriptional regulator/antitoxin HigA
MTEREIPRPIDSEEQLAAYTKALYSLTAEPRPTRAQVQAIELLTLLIERYEQENCTIPKASPADVLRFLIERHGLRQRDLASDLGGESVVSEVLSSKRKLNTARIEKLSRRFRVSPAVFFSS